MLREARFIFRIFSDIFSNWFWKRRAEQRGRQGLKMQNLLQRHVWSNDVIRGLWNISHAKFVNFANFCKQEHTVRDRTQCLKRKKTSNFLTSWSNRDMFEENAWGWPCTSRDLKFHCETIKKGIHLSNYLFWNLGPTTLDFFVEKFKIRRGLWWPCLF